MIRKRPEDDTLARVSFDVHCGQHVAPDACVSESGYRRAKSTTNDHALS